MRIGVNIPNDLYRRMQPIKHTINVSQVCREALEAHVEDYERARDRLEADHMDEAVDRLSQEEEQLEVDWKELGWADAKTWVDGASKEYFDHISHRVDVLKRQGRPTWEGVIHSPYVEGSQSFNQRWVEHSEYFNQIFATNPERNPVREAEEEYGRAWLAYVCAVEEKIQRLRKDRLIAKLESPTERVEPEVPEQLIP